MNTESWHWHWEDFENGVSYGFSPLSQKPAVTLKAINREDVLEVCEFDKDYRGPVMTLRWPAAN